LLTLWADALRVAVKGTLSLTGLVRHLPKLRRYLCDTPRRRCRQLARPIALLPPPP
jgi:hypothetical protein